MTRAICGVSATVLLLATGPALAQTALTPAQADAILAGPCASEAVDARERLAEAGVDWAEFVGLNRRASADDVPRSRIYDMLREARRLAAEDVPLQTEVKRLEICVLTERLAVLDGAAAVAPPK